MIFTQNVDLEVVFSQSNPAGLPHNVAVCPSCILPTETREQLVGSIHLSLHRGGTLLPLCFWCGRKDLLIKLKRLNLPWKANILQYYNVKSI